MPRLKKSDAVRIPAGLVIGWIGVLGLMRGVQAFADAPVGVVVGVLSIAFGLVFIAIGAVMALGWMWARRR